MKEIMAEMGRVITVAMACLILVSNGAMAQETDGLEPAGVEPMHHREGRHPGFRILNVIAERLDLTAAQKAEVRDIVRTERAIIGPLVLELRENRQRLKALPKNGVFYEEEVRAVAEEQAAVLAELIVAKERLKASVFRVLTPAQRAEAEEMLDLARSFRREFIR